MLVLSRKQDQEISIGGDIRIQVIRVSGSTVRLGISAPSNVTILRAELAAADGTAARSEAPLADLIPLAPLDSACSEQAV